MNTTAKAKESEKSEDIEAITAEISRLRSDLASLVDTVSKAGRSRAKGFAASAHDKADEQWAKGEEMLGEVTTELQRLERDLVHATQRSPYRALGIAAAFGFLLAMIMRR